MTDIFLSYNREDQARAKLFAEAFEAQGFKVWWDVGLRTGEAYDQVTEKALKTAKAVVVLWSKKSVESRWVRAEATLADRNKTLVPCMLEPCERPIMFELTQTAELSHWQGDASDKAWAAFLGDVKKFVGPRPEALVPILQEPEYKPAALESSGQRGKLPTLAILPFANRSGQSADDVFAYGMVEDVIEAISLSKEVIVLSSSATAKWANMPVDVRQVGGDLGANYLLEGNVRRSGSNIRVTVQLVETVDTAILWTHRFDRPLSELAELQQDLVGEVAASLGMQLLNNEMGRALKKPGDITAWEAIQRSISAWRRYDAAAIAFAVAETERAIQIAPDYGPSHAFLADALSNVYLNGGIDDAGLRQRVRDAAYHALMLAPEEPFALCRLGHSFTFVGDLDEGLRYTAEAVRKAPGSGWACFYHGMALTSAHKPELALVQLDRSLRLMPDFHIKWATLAFISSSHSHLGRWPEADALMDESIALNPTFDWLRALKATCCLRLERPAEARHHIKAIREFGGDLTKLLFKMRILDKRNPALEGNIAEVASLWSEIEPES